LAKNTKVSTVPATGSPSVGGVTVERIAADIFVKMFMDTSQKTKRYMAEQSLDAAEVFVKAASERKQI